MTVLVFILIPIHTALHRSAESYQVRCGAGEVRVRCGAVRCGAVRCGAVRCGFRVLTIIRCGAARCESLSAKSYDAVRFG